MESLTWLTFLWTNFVLNLIIFRLKDWENDDLVRTDDSEITTIVELQQITNQHRGLSKRMDNQKHIFSGEYKNLDKSYINIYCLSYLVVV